MPEDWHDQPARLLLGCGHTPEEARAPGPRDARQQAVQALSTAGLIELGEDMEAERQLRALRLARNAADPGQWVAEAIQAATAPILAPGTALGQEALDTQPRPGEEHLSERDRLAHRLNLPDSWMETVEDIRSAGPRTIEQWDVDAQACEGRARAEEGKSN